MLLFAIGENFLNTCSHRKNDDFIAFKPMITHVDVYPQNVHSLNEN
jgi:hypothetical protein